MFFAEEYWGGKAQQANSRLFVSANTQVLYPRQVQQSIIIANVSCQIVVAMLTQLKNCQMPN